MPHGPLTSTQPASHEELAQVLRQGLRGARMQMSRRALEHVLVIHTELRKGGSPYWSHLTEGALMLLGLAPLLGGWTDMAIATYLLHDTLEDKPLGRGDIERMFDGLDAIAVQKVVRALELLAKERDGVPDSRIPDEVYFRNMYQEPLAVIPKLVDQIHNLSTSEVWGEEKILRYCDKIESLLLPAARQTRRQPDPELYDVLVHLAWILKTQIKLLRDGAARSRAAVEAAVKGALKAQGPGAPANEGGEGEQAIHEREVEGFDPLYPSEG